MKKIFPLILIILFAFNFISATNLQIEKQSSGEVLVVDSDKPVTFDLEIKNLGKTDYFEFYNLLGFNMFPKGKVLLSQSKTSDVKVELYQIGEIKQRGYYTLAYYIRGENSTEIQEEITFKIIDLADAFKIGAEEIDRETNSIKIYIKNNENLDFKKIEAEFSSQFFKTGKQEFSLAPYEQKNFTIQLGEEDVKKLTAGFYTMKAEITADGKDANVEGTIKFSENEKITTTKQNYGLIISTQVLKKVNEGNTVETSETTFKKNILSRLFTTFSPEPDFVERQGASVYYTWSRQIKPGETLEIVVKTNWLLPFLAIAFIIIIVVFTKKYTGTNLVLRKKVSFVNAKGGEFALKVTLFVQAKRYIERVSVTDSLPALVKLHERFGAEKPTRINEKTRRIEWNFEKLEAGEVRVLSYIIYSKIGLLGKFALPSANAIFEREGKIKETTSNRAFFIAEQKAGKKEDEEY